MATVSQEYSHIGPRQVRPLANFDARDYRDLRSIGIDITDSAIRGMMDNLMPVGTMDALQPLVGTVPSITTPIQFLQNWLPGFVYIMTAARNIDEFVGITTSGAWEDEEIVQGGLERTGNAVPYGDLTNVPLSSWNANFMTRTNVRFEEGMMVAILEEARASRVKINSAQEKRNAASEALEIQRNAVGFFGFNAGDNLTYGLLNDPNLPAYTTFPNGAKGSSTWAQKSLQEIIADIRTMLAQLRVQSLGRVDPKKTPIILGLALGAVDQLGQTSDFGYSVQKWLSDTYGNVTVVTAPELDNAQGGLNVCYCYALSSSGDGSTDDGRTFLQVVPAKFRTLGVMQKTKGYEEDYSNATCGVMLKRPLNVVRFAGN